MPYVAKKTKGIKTDSLDDLGTSVEDLAGFVENEFEAVASAMQSTEPDQIWNSAPPKPRRGTYAYADGTNWNPGAGEGPYFFNGTIWKPMSASSVGATVIRSYLAGFTISMTGASTTFTVAPGTAADSTNTVNITLGSTINKTSAAWVVGNGNGALDTGTIAAGGYHVFVIRRPDTGVVDVLISLSATAPLLPPNYTVFRRIGFLGFVGGVWMKYTQFGDEFLWDLPKRDVVNSTVGTSAITVALSVATGVQVRAIMTIDGTVASGSMLLLASSFDQTDNNPLGPPNIWTIFNPSTAVYGQAVVFIRTNTSGQFRLRSSAANTNYDIVTHGWIDTRGRDL